VSLYREAGRGGTHTLAIAAAVALLAGLGIGFALGRSSAPEPSAADVVSDLRSDLRPVAGGVALIPNEYAQAYRNEGAEAEGVRGALARIKAQLDAARPDLRTLDPGGTKALDDAYAALASAVDQKAAPGEVGRRARAVATALAAVPGGR
jgi:hypothetical protein